MDPSHLWGECSCKLHSQTYRACATLSRLECTQLCVGISTYIKDAMRPSSTARANNSKHTYKRRRIQITKCTQQSVLKFTKTLHPEAHCKALHMALVRRPGGPVQWIVVCRNDGRCLPNRRALCKANTTGPGNLVPKRRNRIRDSNQATTLRRLPSAGVINRVFLFRQFSAMHRQRTHINALARIMLALFAHAYQAIGGQVPVRLGIAAATVFILLHAAGLAYAQNSNNVPVITDVSITSSPGDDGGYASGDVIEVGITFDREIQVTGSPEVTISIGQTDRSAEHSHTDGTTVLFTYTGCHRR